jgi:hypothetical protein
MLDIYPEASRRLLRLLTVTDKFLCNKVVPAEGKPLQYSVEYKTCPTRKPGKHVFKFKL